MVLLIYFFPFKNETNLTLRRLGVGVMGFVHPKKKKKE